MKKFYSCLPVFLLIGCAQVPPLPPEVSLYNSLKFKKSNKPMQIVLISVCLFRTYHQTLRRIKHYQTKNLKIPHQK